MGFKETMDLMGQVLDGAGVLVVALGIAAASVQAGLRLARRETGVYEQYRRLLGRSILLGLEFLVAADIIRTVAVEPSFENVGILALIVAIRTFLSFTLELEVSGRWPWQKEPASGRVS